MSADNPMTTDYCAVCGCSPDAAEHGPFTGAHEYVYPARVDVTGAVADKENRTVSGVKFHLPATPRKR